MKVLERTVLWSLGLGVTAPVVLGADFSADDPFMRYLAPLTFGDEPGPCPNREEECYTNWANAPAFIQNIYVAAIDATLGDVIVQGEFGIWNLQCGNVELDSLVFNSPDPTFVEENGIKKEAKVGFTLDDLALDCSMNARYENLIVDSQTFFGEISLGTLDDIIIRFEKSEMVADGSGISVNSEMRFFSEDFDAEFPSEMDFLSFDTAETQCEIDISGGFKLELDLDLGFLLDSVINLLIDVLLSLFKGLVEGIACSVIVQLAYLDGPVQGAKGGFNLAMESFYETIETYKREGIQNEVDFRNSEEFLVATLSAKDVIDPTKDLNFATTGFFEGVSFGINDVIGGESSNPEYDLVINEIVDTLIGDTTGIFAVDDLRDFFELDEYPSAALQTAASGVELSLRSFELSGLNHVNRIEILENNFGSEQEPFEYTLQNSIGYDEFGIHLNFDLRFVPGEWITSPSSPQSSEPINFDMDFAFEEVDVSIASFILLRLEEALPIQLGQLLSSQFSLADTFYCVLPVVPYFSLSGLQMGFSAFEEPSISGSSSLASLVQETLDVANLMIMGGLSNHLPVIMENFLRPAFNDATESLFLDTSGQDTTCNSYDSQIYSPASFQIADSLAAGFLFDVVDVIAGDPVVESDFSINNIIVTLLEYVLIDRQEPLFDGILASPSPGTLVLTQEISVEVLLGNTGEYTEIPNDQVDQLKLHVEGPTLANINSIGQMVVNNVQLPGSTDFDPYAASVVLQYGYYENPEIAFFPALSFSLPFEMYSMVDGVLQADESFSVGLDLSLDINFLVAAQIDVDRTYSSTVQMLTENLACMFAVLNDKELREIEMIVSDFELRITPVTEFNRDTRFGAAIAAVENDFNAYQGLTRHVLNYVLSALSTESQAIFNTDFNPPYTIETCETAESPLVGTPFGPDAALPSIDFGAINTFLNEATTYQPSPRGLPPSDFETPILNTIAAIEGYSGSDDVPAYDITSEANGYLSILSGALTASSIRNFVISIANSTINPNQASVFDFLIETLELEEPTDEEDDEVRVSFVYDIGESLGWNYDPVGEPLIDDLKIIFDPIRIRNVHTFQQVDLLKPYEIDDDVAKFTTTHDLVYGGTPEGENALTLEFGVNIEVSSDIVDLDDTLTGPVSGRLELEVQLSQLSVDIMTTLALNELTLRETVFGDLITFNEETQTFSLRNEGLNCVLPNLVYLGGLILPQFQVNFRSDEGTLDTFEMTLNSEGDLFSANVLELIEASTEILVVSLLSQLPNLSQGPIRDFLNEFIDEYIQESHLQTCADYREELPNFDSLELGKVLNFGSSDLSSDITQLISSELLNTASPLNLNRILESASFVVGGLGRIDLLDGYNIQYNGNDFGLGNVAIGEFQLPGLGTEGLIADLELLNNAPYGSEEPTRITNRLVFDGPAASSFRFAYTFDEIFQGAFDAGSTYTDAFVEPLGENLVYNDLSIELSIFDLELEFDLDMKVDILELMELNVGNVLNLYTTPNEANCLLAIFDYEGLVPHNFRVDFSDVSMKFECRSVCNSPLLEPLETGTVQTTDEINDLVTDGILGVLALAEVFLSNGAFVVNEESQENAFQNLLDEQIRQAKEECVAIDFPEVTLPPEEEIYHVSYHMLIFGLIMFALILAYFATLIPKHVARKTELLKKLKADGASEEEKRLEKMLLIPLAFHPAISPKQRLISIFLGVASLGLLVSGNFGAPGATAVIRANIFGSETADINLLDFTLASSIDDAWNSGAYALALIIVIASGYWPYSKLIMLAFSAFASRTILPKNSRTHLLKLLDSLGKWSLIDAYVLIMLQVAFRFHLSSSTVDILSFTNDTTAEVSDDPSLELATLDVIVVPKYGSLGFILAVICALVFNHVLVYQDMKINEYDESARNKVKGYVATDKKLLKSKKSAVSKHKFFITAKPIESDSETGKKGGTVLDKTVTYRVSRDFRVATIGLAVLSCCFLVIGLFVKIIRFDFTGVGALFMSVVDPDLVERTLSPFDILQQLSDGQGATPFYSLIIAVIQLSYVMFVVITPIGAIAASLFLFFGKLSVNSQGALLFITEIFNAWEAVVIFSASILGAVLQISQMADFIIRAATGNLCTVFQDTLVDFGVPEEDAACFNVQASVVPSGYLLFGASFGVLFLRVALFTLNSIVIDNRVKQAKYGLVKASDGDNSAQLAEIAASIKKPTLLKGIFDKTMVSIAIEKKSRNTTNRHEDAEASDGNLRASHRTVVTTANPLFASAEMGLSPSVTEEDFDAKTVISQRPPRPDDMRMSVVTQQIQKSNKSVLSRVETFSKQNSTRIVDDEGFPTPAQSKEDFPVRRGSDSSMDV